MNPFTSEEHLESIFSTLDGNPVDGQRLLDTIFLQAIENWCAHQRGTFVPAGSDPDLWLPMEGSMGKAIWDIMDRVFVRERS